MRYAADDDQGSSVVAGMILGRVSGIVVRSLPAPQPATVEA
jgi:hypothetical protein